MTIGTAMVARMKVRRTGVRVTSQLPSVRLRTVRVGKTASQIIRASWCLLGGPDPTGLAGAGVVMRRLVQGCESGVGGPGSRAADSRGRRFGRLRRRGRR